MRYLLVLLIIFLSWQGCVVPYDKVIRANHQVFIVEGLLSTEASENFVRITEAIPNNSTTSNFLPVADADVRLLINGTSEITLNEYRSGYYLFPTGFIAKPDETYQLKFYTKEGNAYESTVETLPPPVQIDSVYHQWNPEAIQHFDEYSPGHEIFIDTHDDPDTNNFYQWTWRLYEKQVWCKNCPRVTLFFPGSTPDSPGECIVQDNIYIPSYDYRCNRDCWDIYPSRAIQTFDDKYSNGGRIDRIRVAEIPYIQRRAALVDIVQLGINSNYYNYLDLIKKQTLETGGLADTPPVTLAGNMKSLEDPDLAIGGYFVVASANKITYWLDRTDIPAGFSPIGTLNGRIPNPEPDNLGAGRPPLAPCLEGDLRTPYMPKGWQN